MDKRVKQFMEYLTKLTPEQFIGVAKIMNIALMQDDEVRPAEVLIDDLIDKFKSYSKIRQKNLLLIMKKAVK